VALTPARAQDPKAKAPPADQVAAKVVPVWPGLAPGSEGWKQKEVEYRNDWDRKAMVRNVTAPTLTASLPDPSAATGAAVVICPGGGFRFLSWQSEGTEVAQWLRARGVAAFVLKYRVMETPASEESFRKEMAAFFGRLANRKERTDADDTSRLYAEFCIRPVMATTGLCRRKVFTCRQSGTVAVAGWHNPLVHRSSRNWSSFSLAR
jgi:hypothetical protein